MPWRSGATWYTRSCEGSIPCLAAPAAGGDPERDVARTPHERGPAHDAIARAPDREVPAGAQHAGLIAGLAVQRDDVTGGQLGAIALDEQTGLVRTDDAESEPHHQR